MITSNTIITACRNGFTRKGEKAKYVEHKRIYRNPKITFKLSKSTNIADFDEFQNELDTHIKMMKTKHLIDDIKVNTNPKFIGGKGGKPSDFKDLEEFDDLKKAYDDGDYSQVEGALEDFFNVAKDDGSEEFKELKDAFDEGDYQDIEHALDRFLKSVKKSKKINSQSNVDLINDNDNINIRRSNMKEDIKDNPRFIGGKGEMVSVLYEGTDKQLYRHSFDNNPKFEVKNNKMVVQPVVATKENGIIS